MKQVIYLKDVEYSDIEEKLEFKKEDIVILKHSDFFSNRKNQIKQIRSLDPETFVLAIYDKNYLKWSLIFKLMVFFSGAKERYIIDLSGFKENVNIISISKDLIFSVLSVIIQSLFILKVPFMFFRWHKRNSKQQIKKEINDLNVAYIRTTDTFNLTAGGSLGHTLGIINNLLKSVKKVSFFGIDDIGGIDNKIDKHIVAPRSFFNYVVIFNRFLYSNYFVHKVKNQFKKNNYDVIYQRISIDNYSGVVLSNLFKIPLIIEFNSSVHWLNSGSDNYLEKMLIKISDIVERICLYQATLIVTVSEELKNELVLKGYSDSKILVVANAVDSDKFTSNNLNKIRHKLAIDENEIVLGFSGTFGFWHGINILESALLQLLQKGLKFRFLLIGDGYYRQEIQKNLSDYDNIIFSGKVPYNSMVDYLSACDILISPHNMPKKKKFIGSPTKLYEYLSMGKIIIASDLGQISQIMSPSLRIKAQNQRFSMSKEKTDQIGLLVDPGDHRQLAFAMKYAIENIDSLRYMGQNARQKAIEKYTWENAVNIILNYMIESNILVKSE